MSPESFTGRHRQRQTRWTVHWADRAARWLIVAGGIGTILAVCTVCVFLVVVVLPLFFPARIGAPQAVERRGEPPLRLAIDDYNVAACLLARDGTATLLQLSDGQPLDQHPFLSGQGLTAAACNESHAAFGFADGKVCLGRIGFQTEFVSAREAVRGSQIAACRHRVGI